MLKECAQAAPQVSASGILAAVVAIDPSGGDSAANDEAGIVACGLGVDGRGYVLEDKSGRFSPAVWAQRAVDLYKDLKADRIVGEANFGGAMVEAVIRSVDKNVPYMAVTASRGKRLRAEPVAALYETGRVSHVGELPALEGEMVTWDPVTSTVSPGRIDAMVWAITELMLGESNTGMLDWMAQQVAAKEAREAEQWLRGRQWLDNAGNITAAGRTALLTPGDAGWQKGSRGMLEAAAG